MIISFSGCNLPAGKIKYKDARFDALVAKDKPKKESPFYAEFVKDEFAKFDCILVSKDKLLDVIVSDLEKCEERIGKFSSEDEVIKKCISALESEKLICDLLNDDELKSIAGYNFTTAKPAAIVDKDIDSNKAIETALEKAGVVLFYTSGPQEVHVWNVPKNSDIVTCAGKIHTDLARGFIKADIVSFEDYIKAHNMNDCRKLGLVKVVDRDYIIQSGDIIEIRFNV